MLPPDTVGQAVKLQIPGEPPEVEYTTKETRHVIVDDLASVEISDSDEDRDFIATVESYFNELQTPIPTAAVYAPQLPPRPTM